MDSTSAAARAERARNVADTLGTLRAEGLTPPPAAQADMDAYVEGTLTVDQGVERALRRHGLAPAATKSA